MDMRTLFKPWAKLRLVGEETRHHVSNKVMTERQ